MRFLLTLLISLGAGCSTVTMNAEAGESVSCNFKVQAPFLVKCTSSAGKEFEWSGPMKLVIDGVCQPCPDGSCPSCGAP